LVTVADDVLQKLLIGMGVVQRNGEIAKRERPIAILPPATVVCAKEGGIAIVLHGVLPTERVRTRLIRSTYSRHRQSIRIGDGDIPN
ncbi:hypothetical protein HUU61_17010, partial [Rhodopseudomonas palustris]|nr:hypothetical protein [Rhodopseudomonas palustris]